MCGRFTLRHSRREIAEAFQVLLFADLEPRYNIAPTQSVAVIRESAVESQGPGPHATRELAMLHWGLIPSWSDNRTIGNRPINARSETAATKPAFREAMRQRRCLVVADGFYEWQQLGGRKQPYLIECDSGGLFAMAGLWERWERADESVESCTILTTAANRLLAPLHERMPVILPESTYDLWLDSTVREPEALQPLLVPFADERMRTTSVGTRVNSTRNDDSHCVEPVTRSPARPLFPDA